MHSLNSSAELASVVVKATTAHPKSINMWLLRLKYHEECSQRRTGRKSVKKGVAVEEVVKEALRKVSMEVSTLINVDTCIHMLDCCTISLPPSNSFP